MNSIAGAYQRKEYGWFFAAILFVIAGTKLAGIGGAIGAALMIEGLYRTFKNEKYSVAMKSVVSLAYVAGGVVIALLIAFALTFVLQKFFGYGAPTTDVAKQVLNATNTEPVQSETAMTQEESTNAAESRAQSTSVNSYPDLETTAYSDASNNFEIRYPKGWIVQPGGTDGTVVQFDEPAQNILALQTVNIDSGLSGYSAQEYAAGGMESFATASGQDQQVKVISQGAITLNGQAAYKVEFTYLYPLPDGQGIPFQATSIYFIRGGKGYNIFATAQVEVWNNYSKRFADSASTFRFLK